MTITSPFGRGLAGLLFVCPVFAYSVLTHEAIIDSAWDKDIKPLLQRRFPAATPDDLLEAHAYAYGGCILQDMGYYPFGSKEFSDLVHYVRSGDFVRALFQEAQNLNEYAFAFGALAHYAADINGHSVAVNRAVPIEFPKLEQEYGPVVTYAENPVAHIRTEFGFDVLQVARGRYAPKAYHDFIGFKVAKDSLDRAFADTYGIHLKDVFKVESLAFGTYRHTVSGLIPEATRVAWKLNKKKIVQDQPGMTKRKFLYNLSRASYRKEWDGQYQHSGIGTQVLVFVFRLIPKVGPFKALAFKAPTPETARLFEQSFNQTLAQYQILIARQAKNNLVMADLNLDTGKPVVAGQYSLADRAYAKLVQKLADRNVQDVPEATRQNILEFYSGMKAQAPPVVAIKDKEQATDWQKTLAAVNKLRSAQQ